MDTELDAARTHQGLELLLRPRGFGRFVSAAFLTFWLCFWVVGEAFVLWILIAGAIALLTGTPPAPGREPLELGPALATGAFLLVWLSLWTLGGYAAICELLRLLWGRDRIIAGSAVLRVVRRLGPSRSTVEIPRDNLRLIYLAPGGKSVNADTATGPVVLSTLGSPEEREQAATMLRAELRIPEVHEAGMAPSIPEGWQDIVTPEGDAALVKDLRVRSLQTRVALGVTLPIAAVALVLVVQAGNDAKLIPLAAIACTAAVGLAWGTARLVRTRIEWRIGSGTLTRRRRSGDKLRDLFHASRLELTRHSDSDGDDSYVLEAVATGVVESPPSWRRTGRCTIERALGDPALPRRLGRWLAERARIPFEDRTTQEASNRDRDLALARLRESGPFGRRMAGWIDRRSPK